MESRELTCAGQVSLSGADPESVCADGGELEKKPLLMIWLGSNAGGAAAATQPAVSISGSPMDAMLCP